MLTNQRTPTRSSTLRAVRLAVVALLLGLVTVVAGAPLSAGAEPDEPIGGIGLRLLDAPISAKDDPRARVYVVDHLRPGTVIERRIEVANTTGSSRTVLLYSAGASIEDGTFLGSPGEEQNDLASWTSVTPASATVPAGGTKVAVVTIDVPADAAPGEQYGVVWAQTGSEPTEEGGVVQVSRVGIRLYVSVGPGGAPAADFEIESLTAERSIDGNPVVTAIVQNTGGRALDMNGTLELTNGPGDLAAGPFAAELGSTLGIGDSEPVRITLDQRLPDGPWDAVVTLESGLIERTAEATISFPASGGAATFAVTEDGGDGRWAFAEGVWVLALGAVAALALLLAAGWGIRGRSVGRRLAASSIH